MTAVLAPAPSLEGAIVPSVLWILPELFPPGRLTSENTRFVTFAFSHLLYLGHFSHWCKCHVDFSRIVSQFPLDEQFVSKVCVPAASVCTCADCWGWGRGRTGARLGVLQPGCAEVMMFDDAEQQSTWQCVFVIVIKMRGVWVCSVDPACLCARCQHAGY